MELYVLVLGVLAVAAVLDLVVGVANDAVNFLNSAIGSRVAPLRALLWLASAGVLIGAMMSSGMMEVARSGVFQPDRFSFHEVMIIFAAVMIADVLLLDAFNTLGMPTSTTVSMVFELLGAATVIALVKTTMNGEPLSALDGYINGAGALKIITGIVTSVGIAFAAGLSAQWVSRLLFTFNRENEPRWLRPLWSGVALAVIGWFLVVKGLKGVPVASQIASSPLGFPLLVAGGLAVSQLASRLFAVDPLKLTVLAGTFALATAFAGNDLVNFVGVPLAGLTSYQAWAGTGAAPQAFSMGVLAEPVRGQSVFLVIAGVIMAATLHLSAKARSVTETEVELGRQNAGRERFRPGPIARALVSMWLWIDALIKPLVPAGARAQIQRRFELPDRTVDAPAFDLVRASVNLTVASSLIALGTTLKLPLSTTFVTFMVAMGASLADRSWGRDSAVYRVAGVGRVLAGWFLTALIAATTAGTIAALLHAFGAVALGGLVLLAVLVLVSSTRWHRRRVERRRRTSLEAYEQPRRVALLFQKTGEILRRGATMIRKDRANGLLQATREEREIARELEMSALRYAATRPPHERPHFLRLFRLEQECVDSLAAIAEALDEHVRNLHEPLSPDRNELLAGTLEQVAEQFEARAPEERETSRDPSPGGAAGWPEGPGPREAAAVPARSGAPAARARLEGLLQRELKALGDGDTTKSARLVLLVLTELDRLLGSLVAIEDARTPDLLPALEPAPDPAPVRALA